MHRAGQVPPAAAPADRGRRHSQLRPEGVKEGLRSGGELRPADAPGAPRGERQLRAVEQLEQLSTRAVVERQCVLTCRQPLTELEEQGRGVVTRHKERLFAPRPVPQLTDVRPHSADVLPECVGIRIGPLPPGRRMLRQSAAAKERRAGAATPGRVRPYAATPRRVGPYAAEQQGAHEQHRR